MSPLQVLIVDDDPSVVELVQTTLEGAGCRVASAPDGAAALASVQAARPDVVLLDVMLPGLDGLEICAQLRALHADERRLPIVMLSALDRCAYQGLATAAGADDYLGKPFDVVTLVAKVRAWGETSRSPA